MLAAVYDLQRTAGWSIADFRDAMTGKDTYTIYLERVRREGRSVTWTIPVTGNSTVYLYDDAFSLRADDDTGKAVVVHELAHVWDASSGWDLSAKMMEATGSKYCTLCLPPFSYRPGGSPASEYASKNHREDFAEAVTASVYNNLDRFKTEPDANGQQEYRMDPIRRSFVRKAFKQFRNK